MLDRPIFIVGHARGGSTALGAIINWHSHVGPKYDPISCCETLDDLLEATLSHASHSSYSAQLEQKDIWFDYFPGRDVFTHMGRELIAEDPPSSHLPNAELVARLTSQFRERRFLSKAPTNSFRIKALRKLFPNAKFLALYRRGEEVVASWGKRSYGFGKRVDWGNTHYRRLSYLRGIPLFARKWRETLEYLEDLRREVPICAITYDDLLQSPAATLERVFDFLELPREPYIYDVRLIDRTSGWTRAIPWCYRPLLRCLTRTGNRVLADLEHDSRGGADDRARKPAVYRASESLGTRRNKGDKPSSNCDAA